MADPALADPLSQARALIADARQQFAHDVDGVLQAVQEVSEGFGDRVGEIGRLEALRALRAAILEKFDERLPLRPVADPLLLQLVREAYDHFENPESRVDIRDWVKEARPYART